MFKLIGSSSSHNNIMYKYNNRVIIKQTNYTNTQTNYNNTVDYINYNFDAVRSGISIIKRMKHE